MTTNDPLRELVIELDDIARRAGPEEATTERVAERLAAFLAVGAEMEERFCVPRAERYVLYPIYVGEGVCVASAVWDVGQVTPVHDHGTWGVIGVVAGAEREVRYRHAASGGLRACEPAVNRAGSVTVCCTRERDVHQVSCEGSVPCVAIHVYGADIGRITRHSFDERTGESVEFVSPWPSGFQAMFSPSEVRQASPG